MNNCKWTPGPWFVNDGGKHKYLKGMVTVIDKDDGEETVICGNVSEYYGPGTAKANAHLIAAAPELYDLLQQCKAMGLLTIGYDSGADHKQLCAEADRIMAKARGETE